MNTIKIKNMGYIPIDRYQRKNNITLKYTNTISINKLQNIIPNFSYLSSFLKFDKNIKIYSTKAKNLLSPINYDVFIKYLYFLNMDNKYIKKMYLRHIKIFNKYKEPDGSKNNKYDFLNTSLKLVNNFDITKFIIPISNQNIYIEGSHRIALAIINNLNILCMKFDTEDLYFDFIFFKNRGFSQKYLDLIGLIIIELLDDISCLIINNHNTLLKNKIYNNYDVYYYKTISNKTIFLFNNNSSINFSNLKTIIGKDNVYTEYIKFIDKKIIKRYNKLNKRGPIC